jgi:hypothetical protein
VCHAVYMEDVLPKPVLGVFEELNEFAERGHAVWVDACFKFLEWERHNVMFAKPSPETQQEHRRGLLYLLKVTEFMASLNPKDAELENLRERLAESWNYFFKKPTAEEAARLDELTVSIFPNES